ncbi:MAG: hypothetical protein II000_11080 [Clostridia bacterium]|nr:hypothetical protein [Clostridia bacterium]
MRSERAKLKAALAVNLLIVILEILAFSRSLPVYGMRIFVYYTEDSNLLSLIASIVFAASAGLALRNGKDSVPVSVRTLRYVATCCLTVTFLTVTFVFAPMIGKGGIRKMLLSGAMLFTHLLCPVAAVLSFLLLEHRPVLMKKTVWIALIPTVLYAAVAVLLNILRVWKGPYMFLLVYEQPVWASVLWGIMILSGAYFVGKGLLLANRIIGRAES